jgi:signal transduction histidine kinase
VGIAEEDLPLLFEEFRQVGGPEYSRPGSSGLGLSIVRQLTRLHGGEIYVDSEHGHGSTFTVTLKPASSETT